MHPRCRQPARLRSLAAAAVAAGLALSSAAAGAGAAGAVGAAGAAGAVGRAPARGAGVLTGSIHVGGGPCAGDCAAQGGEVSVFTLRGRLVARQRVRPGHRFRFTLAPGRYRLNAGRKLHYEPAFGCPPGAARVRAGRTTHVNVQIMCGVP